MDTESEASVMAVRLNDCDFCGGDKVNSESRYCDYCINDVGRSTLIRVHEVIGAPHHVVRDRNLLIEKHNAENAELKEKLAKVTGQRNELMRTVTLYREYPSQAMVYLLATVAEIEKE